MSRLDNFEDYIQDSMTSWHCPGTAVSIIRDDTVLFRRAFGYRDVENRLPMTVDTRFAMASVTKSFTAMGIALLVDRGKLDWDTPVIEYMPEFILQDPYATRHVTIRDMLSHRTGLPRHDFSAWRLDISRAEFIRRMKYFTFNTSFRNRFQYNNLMYYASAFLVEKVAGQPWESYMEDHIFKPLGMMASNLQPEPALSSQVTARGYRLERDRSGNPVKLVCMPSLKYTDVCPGAAGGLFSTLDDMTRWLTLHINDGRFNNTQFITPHNLKQMHQPQAVIPASGIQKTLQGHTIQTYGMGWFINPYREYTLVHHGGNLEGYSLMIGFVPDRKIGVAVLTNLAVLPMRDVLLYEGIDRALNLDDRDWNSRYHSVFDPLIRAEKKSLDTSEEDRVKNAPPSHAPETFAGVYEADGYPDFEIRLSGKKLKARLVKSLGWGKLEHYHYNVFEWTIADFDESKKILFSANDSGEIDSVSIPIEPSVDNILFTRKKPVLPDDTLCALTGDYDSSIPGLRFTVTIAGGHVFLSQSDAPPQRILPHKVHPSSVAFTQKRTRLEFIRENDLFSLLIVKTPDMTIEARRTL
jgi:CubicO group peptidase (beta-lactamase class C family)